MRGEINYLLGCIEEGYIALRRCIHVAGEHCMHFVQEQEQKIDESCNQLFYLCGPKAYEYISYAIQWADLMYQTRQARAYIQRRIYEYRVICAETIKMGKVA